MSIDDKIFLCNWLKYYYLKYWSDLIIDNIVIWLMKLYIKFENFMIIGRVVFKNLVVL